MRFADSFFHGKFLKENWHRHARARARRHARRRAETQARSHAGTHTGTLHAARTHAPSDPGDAACHALAASPFGAAVALWL